MHQAPLFLVVRISRRNALNDPMQSVVAWIRVQRFLLFTLCNAADALCRLRVNRVNGGSAAMRRRLWGARLMAPNAPRVPYAIPYPSLMENQKRGIIESCGARILALLAQQPNVLLITNGIHGHGSARRPSILSGKLIRLPPLTLLPCLKEI
jgi:hypothetical protein